MGIQRAPLLSFAVCSRLSGLAQAALHNALTTQQGHAFAQTCQSVGIALLERFLHTETNAVILDN